MQPGAPSPGEGLSTLLLPQALPWPNLCSPCSGRPCRPGSCASSQASGTGPPSLCLARAGEGWGRAAGVTRRRVWGLGGALSGGERTRGQHRAGAAGWVLAVNPRPLCPDVDECQAHNGGCHHRCVNTPGSYLCECKPGFRLHVDGRTCLGELPGPAASSSLASLGPALLGAPRSGPGTALFQGPVQRRVGGRGPGPACHGPSSPAPRRAEAQVRGEVPRARLPPGLGPVTGASDRLQPRLAGWDAQVAPLEGRVLS